MKDRIKGIAEKTPSISFKACGNTRENMRKAEDKGKRRSQATALSSGAAAA